VGAVVIAAPLLMAGLGAAPFDDPGEGMHAQIARELGQSRDPFALTLNGVRYVDKPPLLYALLATAFAAFGPGEGAARAVSAVAALSAVAATAWLGARLLGPGGGVLAGLALTSSVAFFAYGRYVRPETLFVAALAGGFALSLIGLRDGRRGLVAVGLAAFGLAGLAKDPLGALAPPLAIGLALALAGRGRPLGRWLPWSGVVGALVLAFGWWVGAELRTPGFTWYTIVDNHVLNVMRARHFPDEDVPLSAVEFLGVAALGASPWVLPASAAVWALARRRAWGAPADFPWTALALWTIGVLAATTLSAFRLPHYGLPAYPAIALLAARGWREHAGQALVVAHALLFAGLAAVCGVAWWYGAAAAREVMELVDVGTRKAAAAGVAVPPWDELVTCFKMGTVGFAGGALGMAAAPIVAVKAGISTGSVAAAVAVLTMLPLTPGVALGLDRVATHRAVRDLAVEVGRRAAPVDLVVHEGPLENSGAFEWYAARRPVLVEARRSVLGFGSTRREAEEVFWDVERLRRAWESERRVWLVTTRPPADSVVATWPTSTLVAVLGGRALYVNASGPAAR
jgi:4-amino-4-deoxy-L-arabinose transferase-like glycosyltransferase